MDYFATSTLEDIYLIISIFYMTMLSLVTLGALIIGFRAKRRVKRKVDEIQHQPMHGKAYVQSLLHALFNK